MYHKFISDGQNQTVFFLSPAMFIFDPRMITVVTIWTDEHEDSKNINLYIYFFQLVYVRQSTNSSRQDFKLVTLVEVDYEANKR